jgi:dolichol-phosphate mannosyltransferase
MTTTYSTGRPLISIVVPCFNEEKVIRTFHKRLVAALHAVDAAIEVLYVNDGSRDRTAEVLCDLQATENSVRILTFSRNFGHQVAVTAGIDQAKGDAIVIIDADLQDPPELIAEMVRLWRKGSHVVYAQRRQRAGESAFKLATASWYYRLINWASEVPIPLDVGDFRLMDRCVVDVLKQMPERDRFLRGMVSWIGFRQEAIQYDRDPRFAGETKYSLRKMVWLATNGVVSFSLKPIHLVSLLGACSVFLALALFGFRFAMSWAWPSSVEAAPLIIPVVAFFSGLQLLGLGIVGQYVGRIYRETQRRPLYIVQTDEREQQIEWRQPIETDSGIENDQRQLSSVSQLDAFVPTSHSA